jgi:CBS domain-containing protein
MKKAADILAAKGPEVWTIPPQATVFEALALMSAKEIGALVVKDGRQPPAGIFSERDYARKVALTGKTSQGTRVAEVMTPADRMTVVGPETTAVECLALMSEKQIRHLPVIDRERLVGLISMRDVVRALLAGRDRQIEDLRGLSEASFIQNFDDQIKGGKE